MCWCVSGLVNGVLVCVWFGNRCVGVWGVVTVVLVCVVNGIWCVGLCVGW